MSHERLGILTHKKDFKILFLIENSSQEDNLYRLISTCIGFSFFFFFQICMKRPHEVPNFSTPWRKLVLELYFGRHFCPTMNCG